MYKILFIKLMLLFIVNCSVTFTSKPNIIQLNASPIKTLAIDYQFPEYDVTFGVYNDTSTFHYCIRHIKTEMSEALEESNLSYRIYSYSNNELEDKDPIGFATKNNLSHLLLYHVEKANIFQHRVTDMKIVLEIYEVENGNKIWSDIIEIEIPENSLAGIKKDYSKDFKIISAAIIKNLKDGKLIRD